MPIRPIDARSVRKVWPMVWIGSAALLCAMPASALYKCVIDKTTSFQEQPCPRQAVQTVIQPRDAAPAAEAPSDAAAASTPPAPGATASSGAPAAPLSDQDKLAALESERLRRDASYALASKANQLAAQVAACERSYGVQFSRSADAARNLTGAVYAQSVLGEVNVAAAQCVAKANALQQELGPLRLDCAARRCN